MEERVQQKREGVICFLQKDERYLLALLEYSPNNRKWNGIGGFCNEGEPLREAVNRELQEEISVNVDTKKLQYVGKIIENNNLTLHVFISNDWEGPLTIKDTSIKQLQWFTPNQIPYDSMWPDNTYWLPDILSGKTIIATVLRDVYTDIKPLTEKDVQLQEVAEIE